MRGINLQYENLKKVERADLRLQRSAYLMSSGALRCSGCEGSSFCVDEVSGHYVCTSCWQVSDSFQDVTHNHEYQDSRCGLRIVNFMDSLSQRDVLAEGETQDVPQVFEDSVSASPITKHRHKKHEGSVADRAVAAMPTKRTRKERRLDRSRLRSWRMSEAFTLLLQRQIKALICAHLTPESASFPGIADRFTSVASTLWTNYLGATGELGGDIWALSFRRMLTALELTLESRRSYIKHCSPEGRSRANQVLPRVGRAGESDSLQLTRILESKLGFGFCWIGWSSLYCPNESENANNPFFLFETNCDQENRSAKDDDDKSSITLSWSDSDSVEEALPQKRPRQLLVSPQSPARQFTEGEETGMSNGVQNLSKMWKKMLIDNLITKQPKRELFWNGYMVKTRSNLLLEYNLGILFLAAFLTLTAINARKVPICQHDFFTLHDLSCLCGDRDKFPYLLADRWVSNHFTSFSVTTQQSLRRSLMPDPFVLARVTIHLINMLGLTERPRLPLCSLVHRSLRQMNFPPEAHQIADSLVTKLGRFVKNAAEMKMGMHYFLPLHRYLRGEVFAMAIVAITGRLLFKLDGSFEHRWSNVARFLAKHPQEATLLEEVLNEGAQTETRGRTVPFDWSSWVCGLPNDPPNLRRPHSGLPNGDAPLNTVRTHSHVVRTARNTKEFLGTASSFDPQVDEGWGEKHGSARCHASKVTKLSLTESLTQLIDRSCITTNDDIEIPRQDAKLHPIPCKSCVHSIKHTIFQRASDQAESNKWVNQDCDALVRAYQFIRKKKISAPELLNKIHPLTSKPDDTYMDWLHILENFDSYDPISGVNFTADIEQTPPLATFPPTVIKFFEDYREQIFTFLSGDKVDPSFTADDIVTSPESGKKAGSLANASLHWFIKTASAMCGTKLPQLLREIECVEHLLGYWPGEALKKPTKLRNLALAHYFDYSVPE
ncbi:hypothetical protein TcWFU_003605 [Taenia crassiceps]|uniref:Rrn7/TAF1B C-terminal cyclin domain-containing protein n=1 Tax=Taenia crassiceps TaxID=6207 RepID=A0ABR4QQR5_9CEST